MLSRRAFAGAILGAAFVKTKSAIAADSYPSRPIRVVSPFPPGSASDTVSRVVLDKVSQILGQTMVIESKAGAGGIVGFSEVAAAEFSFWVGLSAPAKTPRDIVDKLHDATEKALSDPETDEKLTRLGVDPMQMSVDQFAKFVKDDIAATVQLAKDAHIEPAVD